MAKLASVDGGSLGPLQDSPNLVLDGSGFGSSFTDTPTNYDFGMDGVNSPNVVAPFEAFPSQNPTVNQFLAQWGISPTTFPNLTQDALDEFLKEENKWVNKSNKSTVGDYGNSYDQTMVNYYDPNFDEFAHKRRSKSLLQRLQETSDDVDRFYRVGSMCFPLAARLLQHWSQGSGKDIVLSSSDAKKVFDTKAVAKAFRAQEDAFFATLEKFDALRAGSNELSQTAKGDQFNIAFDKPTLPASLSNDAQAFYAFHELDYASLEFKGKVQSSWGINTWTGTVTFTFSDEYAFQPRTKHHPIPCFAITDYDLWVPQQLGLARPFHTKGTYTFPATYSVKRQ